MLCRAKNPQNTVIERGNCAFVFMYDVKKIPIRLVSTITFTIEIDESIAAVSSIIILICVYKNLTEFPNSTQISFKII